MIQGYRYHKLRRTFGKLFRSYSELLSKFGAISFQEYVPKGIIHPVFYGDLVYKLRRVKCESNFISSGSQIVKRLRRRQYGPVIIERTIGLVLGPFTALYRLVLKRCTLTNKAVGTIWRALSKPPQRWQVPDPRPLGLFVGTLSAFGLELAYRLCVPQPTLMDVPIFLIYFYITIYVCVPHFKEQNRGAERCSKLKRSVDMSSSGKNGLNIWTNASPKMGQDLYALVGCWSSVSIRRIIYKFFKCVSFWLHGCCG